MTPNTDEVYDIDENSSIKKVNVTINIGPEVNSGSIDKVENKNTFYCCNCKNKVRFHNKRGRFLNTKCNFSRFSFHQQFQVYLHLCLEHFWINCAVANLQTKKLIY